MAHQAKPYLKCEKKGEHFVLTVMAAGRNGHVLKGRATVLASDKDMLLATIQTLMDAARGIPQR